MDLSTAAWHKSSYSAGETNCVEVARLAGHVAVRDSQHPQHPHLRFDHATWAAFLAQVKREAAT